MPATGVMTAAEAKRAQLAISFLHHFVPTAWTFFLECQENPAPRSVIDRAKRNRDLVLILDAGLFLDAAGDSFLTIVNEFRHGPIPRFSPYSAIRGALEADAWACWMLDPAIDATERLGRTLTLRSKSLFEMKRLGLPPKEKLPPRTTSASHYKKRIKRVLAASKRWKLVSKTHKDGLMAFVGMPNITPLLRSLLPEASAKNKKLTVGEQTYGELSARAHATTWAPIGNTIRVASLNRFQSLGASSLDVLEFIRLLGVAVSLHDEAIKRAAVLAGLEPDSWERRRGEMPS